jgi:hypothetical protein
LKYFAVSESNLNWLMKALANFWACANAKKYLKIKPESHLHKVGHALRAESQGPDRSIRQL